MTDLLFRTQVAAEIDLDPRTIDARYSELAHGSVMIQGRKFLLFSKVAVEAIKAREAASVASK